MFTEDMVAGAGDPSQPSCEVHVIGEVTNLGSKRAVNVTAEASFFDVAEEQQDGATPICTSAVDLGSLDPEDSAIAQFSCELDAADCGDSYRVAFPNHAGGDFSHWL